MQRMHHGVLEMPEIETPACFLWGESDPMLKLEGADRLGEYFADYTLDTVPGAGHFVHCEKPELANHEIQSFFESLG